ncbi:MAG: hypothetical protein V4695_00600 [Pseudomonadota bacterium]
MLSEYFEELYKAYRAELEDLETDSEGKNVLSRRLNEKRTQLASLLPMIEEAPEMVAPVFHGACTFRDPHAMVRLSFTEPADFPTWQMLEPSVDFEPWARKFIALILREPGGARFLISAVCLEFLLEKNSDKSSYAGATADTDAESDGDEETDTEAGEQDLDEAGADWLADQGFDRRG